MLSIQNEMEDMQARDVGENIEVKKKNYILYYLFYCSHDHTYLNLNSKFHYDTCNLYLHALISPMYSNLLYLSL